MIELKRTLAAATVLFGAVVAMNAGAEPPGGAPKGAATRPNGPGKADAARAGGEKGEAKKDKDRGPSDKAGKDAGKAEALTAPGADGAAEPTKPGLRPHSELRALHDELKAGKLKKADVEARLAKLRETNKERQDNHRAALKARWGEQLAKPDAQQELAVHERRMAKLDRLLLLAQTERTGKDADKLTTRIDKLIDLETARHEKRMAELTSTGAATPPAPAQPAAINNEGAK